MGRFHQPGKATLAIILFLLFAAIIIRSLLFLRFPIMLIADSWDYIAISEDIYNHVGFNGHFLGDCRLPMYPLFLVLVRAFAPLDAVTIVLSQSLLGLECIILGILVGWDQPFEHHCCHYGPFLSFNPVLRVVWASCDGGIIVMLRQISKECFL